MSKMSKEILCQLLDDGSDYFLYSMKKKSWFVEQDCNVVDFLSQFVPTVSFDYSVNYSFLGFFQANLLS